MTSPHMSGLRAAAERARVLGAGIEPAWELIPRDFKSLASTGFATRADGREDTRQKR